MKDRKSIKQFYRLWFEFLKLGLTQTKFTKKEKEFYLDWGDVLSYKNFDEWWKSKGHLFGDIKVERGYSKSEYSINIKVPLTQPKSTSLKQIDQIIEEEFDKRYGRKLTPQEKTNNIKIPHKKYPNSGQPKYETLQDTLIIYRDVWIKKAHTKKGSQEFLVDCINHFKNRKFNKRVPDFLREQEDNLNTLRNLNRTIKRGEDIIKNVKSGVFPGKY